MGGVGKLITCDLVCSGVASRLAWSRYVAALEKRYGPVVGYEHRPKTFGNVSGSKLPERALLENGNVVQGRHVTRTWKKAYVGRWNLRPVCHDCPFHSLYRVADITIGDFWGLRAQGGADDGMGVSLVLANSEDADVGRLVNGLLERSDWQAYDAAMACNPDQPRLSSSPEPNAVRGVYLRNVSRFGHMSAYYMARALAGVRKLTGTQHVSDAAKRLADESVADASGNSLANRLVRCKGDCYGCGACASICPHAAIRMVEDVEGFIYPTIDDGLCVGCGLCEKVCPRRARDGMIVSKASKAYAVALKDTEAFLHSSSGGAFWGLAEQVLANGGVVYGTAFDGRLMPCHIRCENAVGSSACRGSKYAQSDMGQSLQNVRNDLLEGKDVFFTGTPCQIAALKRYLDNTRMET